MIQTEKRSGNTPRRHAKIERLASMIESSPAAARLQGQKYISLATLRRNGHEVRTPVWFAEQAGKLYVMTRNDSGKYKRIRNNPSVRVAPCAARGKVTGDWIVAQARMMAPEAEGVARQALARKYFLMRFPWLWSRKNIFLEITLAA